MEISAATFFFPATSQRFRVGAEIAYVGSQIAEEDAFGVFLQMVYSLSDPHRPVDPILVDPIDAPPPAEPIGTPLEVPENK